MAVENMQEVIEYIKANETNEEVKTFVQGLNPISLDRIKTFVGTDKDTKSWFDGEKDTHANKVKETFKKSDLPKLIDDEVKKRFPEKSDKDIEIENVKTELALIKAEKIREQLTNKAIKVLTEKKMPLDIVDMIISNDEESTIKNIETFQKVFEPYVTAEVETRLKSGYKPKNNENKTEITMDQVNKMSQKEIAENWEAIAELMKSGKK